MTNIFLSSTFYDMKEYREAAFSSIDDDPRCKCIRMESFPAASRDIPSFVRQKIAGCDLVVFVLGRLYGTVIPGRDISYTEDEFNATLELKKDFLVFSPTPKARFQAEVDDLIERNIDIKRQRERQQTFTRRVFNAKKQPRYFEDPSDLKYRIAGSIDEFLQAQPRPAAARVNPYYGQMLPLLTDRKRQIDAFSDAFEQSVPGRPQIYIIYGHEEEQHYSCVHRLICRKILYPDKSSGACMLGPRHDRAVVDWPDSEDNEQFALRSLMRQFCEALNPSIPYGVSVEAFCRLATSSPASYLIFRHPLLPDEWNMAARSLYTSRYLQFWSDVGTSLAHGAGDRPAPRILIFFEFKHRFAEEARAKAFEDTLRDLFEKESRQGVRAIFLPPLPRVKLADLNRWYEVHRDRLCPPYNAWPTTKLFTADSWTMIEVERILTQYLGMDSNGN